MNFIHDSVRSQLLKPPSMKNQTEKKNYGAVGNVARKRTGSKEFQNFIMGGYADDKKGKKNKQKKIKKHKKKKKNAFDPDEVEKKRLEQKKSKKRDSRKEENGYNAISDDLVQTLNDLDLKGEDCYDGGTLKRNSMDEKEEEGNISNPNIYEITFNENSVEVQGLICSPAYASSDVSVDDIALIVSPRHYNGFNDLRLD
eukprot:256042_1